MSCCLNTDPEPISKNLSIICFINAKPMAKKCQLRLSKFKYHLFHLLVKYFFYVHEHVFTDLV